MISLLSIFISEVEIVVFSYLKRLSQKIFAFLGDAVLTISTIFAERTIRNLSTCTNIILNDSCDIVAEKDEKYHSVIRMVKLRGSNKGIFLSIF